MCSLKSSVTPAITAFFSTITKFCSYLVVAFFWQLKKNLRSSETPIKTDEKAYLTGLVEQLMLKLLDAENILEHLVQLLLAEDELRGCARSHALLCLARIFVAAVDGVKLSHPGAEDRLLAQTIDLGEAAHALLDVSLEHFPEVVG